MSSPYFYLALLPLLLICFCWNRQKCDRYYRDYLNAVITITMCICGIISIELLKRFDAPALVAIPLVNVLSLLSYCIFTLSLLDTPRDNMPWFGAMIAVLLSSTFVLLIYGAKA